MLLLILVLVTYVFIILLYAALERFLPQIPDSLHGFSGPQDTFTPTLRVIGVAQMLRIFYEILGILLDYKTVKTADLLAVLGDLTGRHPKEGKWLFAKFVRVMRFYEPIGIDFEVILMTILEVIVLCCQLWMLIFAEQLVIICV